MGPAVEGRQFPLAAAIPHGFLGAIQSLRGVKGGSAGSAMQRAQDRSARDTCHGQISDTVPMSKSPLRRRRRPVAAIGRKTRVDDDRVLAAIGRSEPEHSRQSVPSR